MLRSVFLKVLRDQRLPLLWWSLGLLALALLTFYSYPAVRDAPELNRLLEDLPDAIKALVGEEDLVSPAGYLNSQLFSFMIPVLLVMYAVVLGAGAVAGEEERGTLELLLANPISRPAVVLQKFLGLAAVLGVLGVVLWLELWSGAALVEMEVGSGQLLAVTASATLLGVCFGALALAVGCLSGRRTLSLGLSAALAVGAYFLNALAPLVDWLEPFRGLSFFYYYIGHDPLRNGLDAGHVLVLLVATAVLVVVGALGFRRRDLATA